MFARIKKLKTRSQIHQYLQIVESYRENKKPKQRVIATLGRMDRLLAGGTLERLVGSLAKFSETIELIEAAREEKMRAEWAKDWGCALVFEKLWRQVGLDEICRSFQRGRKMAFDLERAAFAAVLQRIQEPGSDLACIRWLRDVHMEGAEGLGVQHLYRSMDILSEHKEQIESELLWRGRELFDLALDLVFFDTTSIYFEGNGPEDVAERGFSRDHWPEKKQLIIGVLMSRKGYPISCEFWPGNTSDMNTLSRAVEGLKGRFKLGRVILVCDRGMVSVENLLALEQAGIEYIVGIPLRRYGDIRDEVLADSAPFQEVEDNLQVKELINRDLRYIVCYNPQQAQRDQALRESMVEAIRKALSSKGPKALVGNRGYRRYLKIERQSVTIDQHKIADEARFDGKFVLLTNTGLPTEEVATSYKKLWQVERAFCDLKNILKVRPVYHRRKMRVQGHIFCNFLALYLKIAMQKALESKELKLPWDEVLSDLKALKAIRLHLNGTTYLLRTDFRGVAHKVFQAVGVKPPPTLQVLQKA